MFTGIYNLYHPNHNNTIDYREDYIKFENCINFNELLNDLITSFKSLAINVNEKKN